MSNDEFMYKHKSELAFAKGQILDKMILLASINPKTLEIEYICIDSHSGGYWWWSTGPISRLGAPKVFKSVEEIGESVEEIGEDPFGSSGYLLSDGRIPFAVEVRCEIASRFEIKETVKMAKLKKLKELNDEAARIQKEIDALEGNK